MWYKPKRISTWTQPQVNNKDTKKKNKTGKDLPTASYLTGTGQLKVFKYLPSNQELLSYYN